MNRLCFLIVLFLTGSVLFGQDRAAVIRDLDAKFELTSNDKNAFDVLSMILGGPNNLLGVDEAYSSRLLGRIKTFPYQQKVLAKVTENSRSRFVDQELTRLLALGDPALLSVVWKAQKQLDDPTIAAQVAQSPPFELGTEKEAAVAELTRFGFQQTGRFQDPIVQLLEKLVGPAVSPEKRPLFDNLLAYIHQAYASDTTEFAAYLLAQNRFIYQNTDLASLQEVNRLHHDAGYLALIKAFSDATLDVTIELIEFAQGGGN